MAERLQKRVPCFGGVQPHGFVERVIVGPDTPVAGAS
jgi:hypothetical protein